MKKNFGWYLETYFPFIVVILMPVLGFFYNKIYISGIDTRRLSENMILEQVVPDGFQKNFKLSLCQTSN